VPPSAAGSRVAPDVPATVGRQGAALRQKGREPEALSATALSQKSFKLPSPSLLDEPGGPAVGDEEIRLKSRKIEATLLQFGLPVEVTEVRVGPTVTQFGVTPGYVERAGTRGRKVRVSQIAALADDLALALAAPRLRVEAPVPGRAVVGIEVPNSSIQLVGVREVIESDNFRRLRSPLAIALGRDVSGEPVVADLAKMPHLLIAGTTGSGKSVCIKAITVCLVSRNAPKDLRLVMIDPKMVELVRFNGLPHLLGRAEVDLERVVRVLRWVSHEMDDRYKMFASAAARNIDDYNQLVARRKGPTLPRIVVMIDELADLMMLAPDEVERTICRIAQMARATGIHLVVATQRPSVDVVTGLIKANFPARISFATASQTDSRVILDMPGAETLLGRGDMLYLAADAGHPVRVQGCFVSEGELERVVRYWRDQVGPFETVVPWDRTTMGSAVTEDEGEPSDAEDELLPEAIELVRERGSASASLLQRRLHIGHPRAARLIRAMEEMGVVGPQESAGRRRRVIIGDGE
jgi:S-DNA-T family DNA segregation ATPase FtsK/SpoIIIE